MTLLSKGESEELACPTNTLRFARWLAYATGHLAAAGSHSVERNDI